MVVRLLLCLNEGFSLWGENSWTDWSERNLLFIDWFYSSDEMIYLSEWCEKANGSLTSACSSAQCDDLTSFGSDCGTEASGTPACSLTVRWTRRSAGLRSAVHRSCFTLWQTERTSDPPDVLWSFTLCTPCEFIYTNTSFRCDINVSSPSESSTFSHFHTSAATETEAASLRVFFCICDKSSKNLLHPICASVSTFPG